MPRQPNSVFERAWKLALPPSVMLAVALWGIGTASFWRDEAATLSAARRSLPQLWRMLGHTDAPHGAYYLLMWVLVRVLGTTEFAARLPSALAMAAAAAGIAAIGRRLLSERAGLAAGLAFAAFPIASRYGQEARSYAVVAALAILASYLLIRGLEANGRGMRWLAGYALVLSALGWTNLIGLLIVPAHAMTLALRSPKISGSRPACVATADAEHAAVGLTPDGLMRHRALARRAWAQHAAGWLAATATAVIMVAPLAVLTWRQLHVYRWLGLTTWGSVFSLAGHLTGSMSVSAAALVMSASGLVHPAGPRARLASLCVPWLLVPPAMLLGLGATWPIYAFRYLVFCVPALALLAGAGLDALAAKAIAARPGWQARGTVSGVTVAATGVILLGVLGLPAQLAYRASDGHTDDIRLADRIVAAKYRGGDAVIFYTDWWRQLAAAYPYGLSRLQDIALGTTPVQDANLTGTPLPLPQIRRKLANVTRVWLVELEAKFHPDPLLEDRAWHATETWQASDIWLVVYERAPPCRVPQRMNSGWSPARPRPGAAGH